MMFKSGVSSLTYQDDTQAHTDQIVNEYGMSMISVLEQMSKPN